jgi:hypothetical protein
MAMIIATSYGMCRVGLCIPVEKSVYTYIPVKKGTVF